MHGKYGLFDFEHSLFFFFFLLFFFLICFVLTFLHVRRNRGRAFLSLCLGHCRWIRLHSSVLLMYQELVTVYVAFKLVSVFLRYAYFLLVFLRLSAPELGTASNENSTIGSPVMQVALPFYFCFLCPLLYCGNAFQGSLIIHILTFVVFILLQPTLCLVYFNSSRICTHIHSKEHLHMSL